MKVLFLDQFSDMGGAQHGLVDTIAAAQRRGWEGYAAVPGTGPLVTELRSRGITVESLPCGPYRSRRKTAADLIRFAFDLRQQIRIIRKLSNRFGFDLLYVNGPRLLPAAALAGQPAPVLFHAHSRIHESTTAKLAGWSIRRANAWVVACSNSVMEPLRPHMQGRSYVIANGVREVPFRLRLFPQKSLRIGMIARISAEKGQVEFLQAARLLARDFPYARFVICGAPLFAERSYYDRVQSLACGLPVEFLGWQEDVGPVFANLDFLVVPSHEEGMGRVIVEAFSAGVPVVAFPTGGIPEVVDDGETGFLTKGTSPEALAARIRETIASGPEVLRHVVANAREAWERLYTLERYQERITAVMDGLASAFPVERETATLPARR